MIELSQQKKDWVKLLTEKILSPMQAEWGHVQDYSYLETDNELVLKATECSDSMDLIVTYPDATWIVEVHPSSYAPVSSDPARFSFTSPHDAQQCMKAFKYYYRNVIKPNMENM